MRIRILSYLKTDAQSDDENAARQALYNMLPEVLFGDYERHLVLLQESSAEYQGAMTSLVNAEQKRFFKSLATAVRAVVKASMKEREDVSKKIEALIGTKDGVIGEGLGEDLSGLAGEYYSEMAKNIMEALSAGYDQALLRNFLREDRSEAEIAAHLSVLSMADMMHALNLMIDAVGREDATSGTDILGGLADGLAAKFSDSEDSKAALELIKEQRAVVASGSSVLHYRELHARRQQRQQQGEKNAADDNLQRQPETKGSSGLR